jgi:hypothetical protein
MLPVIFGRVLSQFEYEPNVELTKDAAREAYGKLAMRASESTRKRQGVPFLLTNNNQVAGHSLRLLRVE